MPKAKLRTSKYRRRYRSGRTKAMLARTRSGRAPYFRTAYRKQHGKLSYTPGAGSVRQPFPPILWTTLSYTVTRNYTTSGIAGTIAAPLQIRANSIYDPEVAVGGGQPRYTDSLLGNNGSTAPYRNYRVHASAIRVRAWKGGTTFTDTDLLYVIPGRDHLSNPSSENEVVERPYAKTRPMNSLYSQGPTTLKHFTKIKWHLGHKDLMDVDGSAAKYDSNPLEQVYWNIGVADVNQGSASAHSITLQISVIYFVQFYTLVDVADS